MKKGTHMPPTKPDTHDVARFKDHEVITPPNKLKGVVGRAIEGDDPVARAEAALAQLSSEFSDWMHDECDQLDRARRDAHAAGMAAPQRDALFRAAHDIKGQAATLGFPLVSAVAESLCVLIDEAYDARCIPAPLIDQHVDAVRAIMREHDRPDAEAIAELLTRRLRDVTAEFLSREGKDRDAPETSPPIAPVK
ncbi:MAG TPA: Hpt domain-containing protein [Xanthobacteraceae bacterium]|jgi:chemotaxis protein histidine kinase CheA